MNRFLPPLYPNRAQCAGFHQMRDEAVGLSGEEDVARFGERLHPRGQVDGITHGSVLYAKIGAHFTHNDKTCVDTYPHCEAGNAMLLFNMNGVFACSGQDVKGGPAGSLRVVLVGQRSAEKGKDCISHQPCESPLIASNRFDKNIERTVHDLHDLLRIKVLCHGSRTFDIAEKHGHDAALTLHVPLPVHQSLNGLGGQVALNR